MPIYRVFNVCLENQEFFREWARGVGTYVQEDNSVMVKSGTMGIGWGGTLCPYMGHVMLSINEITWTGTLYTITYNHLGAFV